jgi:filamentous hemagglutinin
MREASNTTAPRLQTVARAVAAALAACAATHQTHAGQLPVPCVASACSANGGPSNWVTSGAATAVQSGNTLTVNQSTASTTLNWRSFNISPGSTVSFVQPSSSATALNRIFQGSVSQIFGALNSNGTVYLLNQNGILFGTGAVVNVGGLLASSLDLSPAALARGIAGAVNQPSGPNQPVPGPALQPYADETINTGSVTVAPGASITTDAGGQILLFAPQVTNSGTLSSPGGQTMLGAGQTIFLAASADPNIRGLLIEISCGSASAAQCGTVTNTGASSAATGLGQILADTGNVTLAGLAVNQDGRVSATTSVRSNGSIRLQAQGTDLSPVSVAFNALADQSGTLTLGPSSVTSVSLEGGPNDVTVDVNAQPKSQIQMLGGQIDLLAQAAVTAPSGTVTLTALTNPNPPTPFTDPTSQNDSSRIYLAPGSTIDVSGATVSLPVSDNSLAVQLRGSELEDFPQQRAGPLRGQTVYVDIRQHGTRSDGSTWVGTPLADLAGDLSAIQRDVFERNLTGGHIQLTSGGSVIVSPGATLNVSGGQIDWQSGYVKSSMLVGPNGGLTPIGQADPTVPYLGTVDSISQGDPHWGVSSTVTLPGYDPRGTYQAGYVEGKDAGSVGILAPAFVLDGTISAHTVSGPLQRNPTTDFAANPYYPGDVYRFADEVPLGGSLTIGNSAVVTPDNLNLSAAPVQRAVFDSLSFGSGAVLPTLAGPNGGAFDPETDPLPSGFVSSLRPDLFGPGSLSQLSVYAEGSITVPSGITLAPGGGGAVTLVAGRLDFAGDLVANGGTATLVAVPTVFFGGTAGGCAAAACPQTSLTLAPTATIDLRGAWVNEPLSLDPTQLPPLYISGGAASIVSPAGGAIDIASGARIDVSGGAQRTLTGSVVAGKAGSITIAAEPSKLLAVSPDGKTVSDNPTTVALPTSPSTDFAGFALADGGSFSLTLPSLCVSAMACPDPTAYRVDPAVLTSLGFAAVSLHAAPNLLESGGLLVAGDVNVHVSQDNLTFTPGAFAVQTDTLAGITQVTTLPDYLRHPESLTLTADAPKQVGPTFQFADVSIAPTAALAFDPGASVSLATNSRIFLDGTITAPSGAVSVAIRNDIVDTSSTAPYLIPNQAIWLGPGSVIDVGGTAVLTPNTQGLQLGKVLPGGSVTVSAGRGYLIGLPGSEILAGGSSGTLDLSSPGSGTYTRETIASAGGAITLSASEGILYDGVAAAPGGGENVPGGTLSLVLDGSAARASNPLISANPADASAVINAPRVITVTAAGSPVVVGEGADVPSFLDGLGQISATQINAGGFANVSLTARDLTTVNFNGLSLLEPGAVSFGGGVKLNPAESLIIDSGELRGSSGSVQLASSFVQLGSTDTSSQSLNAGAQAGTAELTVQASLIDLVGVLSLNGFGTTKLSSSGDIRLSGVQLDPTGIGGSNLAGFNGQLVSPGPLTLTAQQIYPTTLTNYTVQLTGTSAAQSLLSIGAVPGNAGAVLSAAGTVTLDATAIDDAGVVRAPIGTIALVGQDVTLESGAVLSVSAAGTTIPFGQTQGGFDWVYALRPTGATTVYGTAPGNTPIPGKQISVSAASFQFDKGATIDTSGGGDLSAYEWIPGLGGTKDVLSPTQSPGLYAVLPGLTLPFAPLDPNEDRGFSAPVGSSVYLAGGGGLPAGTYALLPARYALLPGAYLVKSVPGYLDLTAGQSIPQFDGSTIVSGYSVNAVTGLRDSRTSGFDIVSGAYALAQTSPYTLAQYNLSSANTFFTLQAQANNVTTPRLPGDAGDLALAVTNTAQLAGTLAAVAPNGYRAGSVDITANDLFVTSKPSDAPVGAVVLDVDQLDQLGAESLLLGATRTSIGGYTQLNVQEPGTDSNGNPIPGNVVEIDSGAIVKAPEVILAASQAVRLDPGSGLEATGSLIGAEPDLLAPTGTAVVRVATGAQVALNPKSAAAGLGVPTAGNAGSVTVASGASLSAPGSLSIDAGGSVDYAGGLSAAGAAVRLGGQQLALGAAPAGFTGFSIGPSLLQGLAGSDLTLAVTNPANPIAIYGPVQLSLADFTASAPGMLAATADGSLTVQAPNITLGSAVTQPYTPGAGGTAALALSGQHIQLSGGTFTVAGFGTTTLSAGQDLTVAADGVLGVPGALTVNSPIIQSAAGRTYQMIAAGNLVTAGGGGSTTAASGPGGALDLEGATLTLGGHIVLPGGRITATASGTLGVSSGALLDVSGFSESFAGESRSAPGGTIQLTAEGGALTVDAGSTLDVSAGTGSASGGTLALIAPQGSIGIGGTLRGNGGSGGAGGSLSVEAQQLDFGGLVGLAGTGGFTGAVNLHERGPGDFLLGTGTLRAADVELTADQGSIAIGSGAVVDARTGLGGRIVFAAQSIDVAGSLLAGSQTSTDRGGTVELLSSGALALDAGSLISVGGAGSSGAAQSAGTVWLRAPQSVVASVTGTGPAQLRLDGSVTGAGQINLEAYHTPYVLAAGTDLDPTTPQWYTDASNFMSNQAPAVLAALTASPGIATRAGFLLLPGIEIDAQGSGVHVLSPWDLSTQRFGDGSVPGVLTVRAAGSLYVDNSISDGFTNGVLNAAGTRSWSYRLVAGANLASTDPLAVLGVHELAVGDAGSGSIFLAPGTPDAAGQQVVVRTGTGNIDLAAAGDLRLGNQASVIYTAGSNGPPTLGGATGGTFFLAQDGGSVTVDVGRDIIGAPSDQLFTNWLFRTGRNSADPRNGYQPTAWGLSYDNFQQGIGALGGGDLTIRAGRDIIDLGANVPSIGVPVGTAASATTVEENAGTLTVQAGGDIMGGKFLDMAGQGVVTAGGAVRTGNAQPNAGAGLNLILGTGSGQFSVTSRSDLLFEDAVPVTLLPRSRAQSSNGQQTYFGTFTAASSLTLESVGGTLDFTNRNDLVDASSPGQTGRFGGDYPGLHLLAPTFAAVAFGGDVDVNNALVLWPSAHGNLDLLAAGSVQLTNAPILVSDLDPGSLPSANRVSANGIQNLSSVLLLLDPLVGFLDSSDIGAGDPNAPGLHAPQLLHGGAYAADGQPDLVPVRIVALTGDVSQVPEANGTVGAIDVPKAIDISAGKDILDLDLNVQQVSSGDASSIMAGGNITYPFSRDINGVLLPNASAINVAGPGEFEMVAGGTVNLGTSLGISSIGNVYNPALPPLGADISVAAGITQAPHYQDFISTYLATGTTYDQQLEQYVADVAGLHNPSKAQALAAFEALPVAQQAPLIEQVLFDELRAGGRSAAAAGPTHDNFTRAFTALTTLFPDAANDRSKGATVPYAGDLLLYFSRIYTLEGGDINLLAPGGQVNAGLAVAPSSFGIDKGAAALGVVAQSTGSVNVLAYGDIQVNQSRVFAANGGNILMWSTFGNIDAGRGAKTAISAPPPITTIDPTTGKTTTVFPPALQGSGIQTLASSQGVTPGDVDLFAPNGVVNANDAGIVAGNLTIAATAVLGANNISVSGSAVGLPPPALALGAVTSSASSTSSAASSSAQGSAESGGGGSQSTPHAEAALGWLDVFVLGLGEEQCKPEDVECLKRQKH